MLRRWDCTALADLDGDNKYTYAQLAAGIKRLHVTWKEMGIKEGDKIALCGRNCANWGLLFLAAESYKAVVVSILPDFTADGIYSLVDHSEAVLLYVGPNVKKKIDTKQMKGLKATIFMDDMTIVDADEATRESL
jgi:long-chain acyl-CoA synthetase